MSYAGLATCSTLVMPASAAACAATDGASVPARKAVTGPPSCAAAVTAGSDADEIWPARCSRMASVLSRRAWRALRAGWRAREERRARRAEIDDIAVDVDGCGRIAGSVAGAVMVEVPLGCIRRQVGHVSSAH